MSFTLCAFLALGALIGLIKRRRVYDDFVQGAQDGFSMLKTTAANVCAAVICISVMKSSGLMDALTQLLGGVLEKLGIPKELTALTLLRPLSGSASMALLNQIMAQYGPDSMISRIACCMFGSTETVFYTLAVYLSGVAAKRSGWVLVISLFTCLVGAVSASWLCRFL